MPTPAFSAADAPDPVRRRRLVLAVGAAALLAGGAGSYLALGAGGEDTSVAAGPVRRERPPATASTRPAPTAAPPVEFVPGSARNPYRALYVQAPAATSPTAGPPAASPPAAPTPSPTAAPKPSPTGVPAPAPVASRRSSPAPAPTSSAPPVVVPPVVVPPVVVPTTVAPAPATYPLTLLGISGPDRAGNYTFRWRVRGVVTDTVTGQAFGRTGELRTLEVRLSSSGRRTAVVQVGAALPITVRVGQTVRVP